MHSLINGGAMGDAMRSFDWQSNPLGPVEQWPQPLKTAVSLMLNSKFPMFLAWGDRLTFLYNDGYAEILGQKHPALGKPFEEIWSEIWRDIKPIVDKALAGEATFWEDLPLTLIRRGEPEQAWFTFSYSSLYDESGTVRGMFCVVTETTAKVLGEQSRMREMERLSRLLDRAPSFMAVVAGKDLRFYLANQAYLDTINETEIIGRPAREVFPPETYPGAAERLEEVMRTGKAYAVEGAHVLLHGKDGTPPREVVLDYLVQPIVENDQILGVFVAGNDVTARHQAERRLRESEERFRLIADSAPVPIWVTKPDRTRSFVNEAYVDFLGVDRKAAETFDWRTILHPDDHDRVVAESVAGEASLKPFVLEARYRRGDGEWRWIRSTSQPRWGPDGEHDGFIGSAHDVTESKEAEVALREMNETLERRVQERTADLQAALDRLQQEVVERERAQEALRQAQKMEAVGQLTGGIAHDFNNLLTPIIGGLDLLTRRLEDPRLKRVAQAALESGNRGAKLATQLLAFSRLQRIAMAAVPVNKVIADMGRMLHHSIGPKIAVRMDLSEEAGHALCDANQLENALLNLAINARDAMLEGGTLTISTALRQEPEGAGVKAGDYVSICVADTGEGMPPHILARAMEPFFSTKPVGKGTGLGLAQVYGIAQQSGGGVRLHSVEGEGTRVEILLPRAAPQEGEALAAEEEQIAAPERTGADILVIDDDPEVRRFLSHALSELGHRVKVCECARTGLAQLETSAPDLVLIDFAMPVMNGADLAVEIRARNPDQRIVFVTGYAETQQLEAALGADVPVLRKPFRIGELAAMISRHAPPAAA